ncbi:DUF362 domain-containing protein [Desulfovibrio aminophilus]|uniref:DUF362 domain-containing protein n=1 Tax=Desulfovibrio aminophilus TaxID=81425 RepID=UPI000429F1AC|nr:DUF362 domain-containing protein [Desulfovibrio aminophilus]
MTTSTVHFWNLRASLKSGNEARLTKLVKAAGKDLGLAPGDLTAVKIHFGEQGVTGFVRPLLLKPLISWLVGQGAKPFLTDASTLYVGRRGEAVSHHLVAAEHGFDPLVLGAPVIIADGVKGQHQEAVRIRGRHVKKAFIAGDIAAADALVSVNHVKGHEMAGFGGALKNLGMGCASKQGKMHQHITTGPVLDPEKCVGCGSCALVCAAGALVLGEAGKAVLDMEKCVGCGMCFTACKTGALAIDWKTDIQAFLERMMEYAKAVLATKRGPCLHLNFVLSVVPDCDCMGFTDAAICPDIGVLASTDPVAVDQASVDLVNAAQPLWPSRLPKGLKPGDDKFLAVHPHVPEDMGLAYAEKIGLGSRKYKLTQI